MEVFKCDCLGCLARRICLSPVRTNQANERDIGPKKDEGEDLTFGSLGKAGGRKLGFQWSGASAADLWQQSRTCIGQCQFKDFASPHAHKFCMATR
jgi:hypothetical protein